MESMKEWVFKVAVVFVGVILVFVSVAKASYEILAKEIGEDAIKNRNLVYVIKYSDGTTEPANYKLPEVGILPSNPFYGFKKIRDWIWISMAKGSNKAQVVLLIADKKMTEASDLFDDGQNRLAVEAGNEAIDKLEYANSIFDTIAVPTDIQLQLKKQIFLAGFAYKQIASKGSKNFDMDQQNYLDLINRIDVWNEKQEKERYTWQK